MVDRLQDAARLRDRVAHSSQKCHNDFKSTARLFLDPSDDGTLLQGYGVGDLLIEQAERCFVRSVADSRLTFFEAYKEMFQAIATKIVPPRTLRIRLGSRHRLR